MDKTNQHPGAYVREHVLPAGMTVKEAAKRLDIGRPALSNFLNGNADLSADLAAKLERAFGASARELLDKQGAWDAQHAKGSTALAALKPYVPPFLEITANTIAEWADTIDARQRFAVFLRTLVNSTGTGLTLVDFPGNDDSQRAGWDGRIEAKMPNPWIPKGQSGWEFGVSKDPKAKAEKDFLKAVAATPADQRKAMTFVFVTPRRWTGKSDWIIQKRADAQWQDVRAYDASDLEQWLEQSIAGQVWFANETGQAAQGAISLDEAQRRWAADCGTVFGPALFEEAIEAHRASLRAAVLSETIRPITIKAESKEEALGFLSAAYASSDAELGPFRDRVIVFEEPGALKKLAARVSNFIPVITSSEVGKEFAPHRNTMRGFIIHPRNAPSSDPDIELDSLSYEAFSKALEEAGVHRDRISQLDRDTGRSLTVLRRRLSETAAIQTPDWATDTTLAQNLIPFLFAGSWNAKNAADCKVLENLAGDAPHTELERRLTALLPLDSAPVWSAGSFRGVVSKIDILFAIAHQITEEDLARFFRVARDVLSELDPALDLPEADRWAAVAYNKTREISGALRKSIAETVVLLAVHGRNRFRSRINFDPVSAAESLVRDLLTPMDAKTLESQAVDLPLYAEAAPDTFLALVESDLRSPEPATLKLIRPIANVTFSRTPRTGLLWALEGLAWSSQLFMRTVLVLGRLSERQIDDNLSNKPSGSLASIFRNWMPQTSANLDARKQALQKLAETYPSVAWPICVDQFAAHSRTGTYSHKPRWRPDGHGHGSPVSRAEANDFAVFCFKLAIGWPTHTRTTIGDLIANLEALDESFRLQLWGLVDAWAATACAEDRAWLRESIRVSVLGRRAAIRSKGRPKQASDRRARLAYEALEPADPVLRHQWLFAQPWVEETVQEAFEDEDFRTRDERINGLREAAAREVFEVGGVDALVRLAATGDAQSNVGWAFASHVIKLNSLRDVLIELIGNEPLGGVRANVVAGLLEGAGDRSYDALADILPKLESDVALSLLFASPFHLKTWALVDALGQDAADLYWRGVTPRPVRDVEIVKEAVDRLIAAGRPRAAFAFSRWKFDELPPQTLFELLNSVRDKSNEPQGTYMLDSYYVLKAFQLLNEAGGFPLDEMAALEFAFIDVFDRHKDGTRPINIERKIEDNPQIYAQFIATVYRRDGSDDDEGSEMDEADRDALSRRATACFKLLNNMRLIPGRNEIGAIETDRLIGWIDAVRQECVALGRITMGEHTIGGLLAHAPAAEDGVWPCMPVRDALDQVLTDQMEKGLYFGLLNLRGVHYRGEGGAQERELANRYGGWARQMDYTHPRVASALRKVQKRYEWEADLEDREALVARRLAR